MMMKMVVKMKRSPKYFVLEKKYFEIVYYILDISKNVTTTPGSQIYIFIYAWAYIRFSPKARFF